MLDLDATVKNELDRHPAAIFAIRTYRAHVPGVAFIDGEYVPIEQARIPILDWGLLRSDATYDVVHVWRGSFFRLADHLSGSCAVCADCGSRCHSTGTRSSASSPSAYGEAACARRTWR